MRRSLFVSVLVLGIAGTLPAQPPSSKTGGGFGALLERAAAHPEEWSTVRLEADGRLGTEVRSLTVYGRGVGIWNGERQFALDEKDVGRILRLLVERKFADLPELLGGEEEDEGTPGEHEKPLDRHPPKQGKAPRYLLRMLTVTVDGVSRTVIQEAEVPEARPFVALLGELVRICRKPAARGITAPDLATGLAMVADGRLAPETLSILVNAPQLRSLPSQEGQGWILTIRHGELEDATQVLGRGVVDRVHRRMKAEEIQELAGKLLEAGTPSLPQRINTSGYTQLTLQVLDKKVSVMARTYAGAVDAEAKRQAKTFAGVRAILAALHRPGGR